MGSLNSKLAIIRQTIAEYAKPSLTGELSYLTQNADGKVFSVVDVTTSGRNHSADTGLVVRLEADYIIIEHDQNNKPLVDALVQAGILRQQIILAYAGKAIPTNVPV